MSYTGRVLQQFKEYSVALAHDDITLVLVPSAPVDATYQVLDSAMYAFYDNEYRRLTTPYVGGIVNTVHGDGIVLRITGSVILIKTMCGTNYEVDYSDVFLVVDYTHVHDQAATTAAQARDTGVWY